MHTDMIWQTAPVPAPRVSARDPARSVQPGRGVCFFPMKTKNTVIINSAANRIPHAMSTPSCAKPAVSLMSRQRNAAAVVSAPKMTPLP